MYAKNLQRARVPNASLKEKEYLCDACAKEHACGEELLQPVVNSPRAGVCGYPG